MTATPYPIESGDRYTSLEEARQTARSLSPTMSPLGTTDASSRQSSTRRTPSSQRTSATMQQGLHDLARQGYAPGDFPVGCLAEKTQIGVKNDGDPHSASRWIPVPEPVPCVQKAWKIRAHGPAYNEIHWTTRVSGFTNSYACMFRNRTYLSTRKYGNLEVSDAHEPLISWEIRDAVQATL